MFKKIKDNGNFATVGCKFGVEFTFVPFTNCTKMIPLSLLIYQRWRAGRGISVFGEIFSDISSTAMF